MGYVKHSKQTGIQKGKIRYRFEIYIDGKRYRKMVVLYPSTVDTTYRKWEREQLDRDTQKAKSHRLFEIIDLYLGYIRERRDKHYINAHTNELSLFKSFIGNIPINDIRRYHVMDFSHWRKSHSLKSSQTEVKQRAVNYSISVLSVFFNFSIDREYYSSPNPASRLKSPEDNYREVILTADHVAELLYKAKNKCVWLYTAVMLALFAGLRRKETLCLTWSDVDFGHGVINLPAAATKSKKPRSIPLPDFLENHLNGLDKLGKWVLMDGDKRVLYDQFWYHWERLRTTLSFSKLPNGLTLTFHDLRHVYAQSLRDAGINLGDIQAYMGHSSVELTVRRYAQRGGVDGKDKVNRLINVYNLH